MSDADIEIAALVIQDLLYLLPAEKRVAALARAADAEETARNERERHGRRISMRVSDVSDGWIQYWHDAMKFRARLAYALIRRICNNHSDQDAARLLFTQQRGVSGSGYLKDYLANQPER